jgi:hypothetical protein
MKSRFTHVSKPTATAAKSEQRQETASAAGASGTPVAENTSTETAAAFSAATI